MDHRLSCDQVALRIEKERPDRVQHAHGVANGLRPALLTAGISAEVSTRIKTPCSARDKMRRKGLD